MSRVSRVLTGPLTAVRISGHTYFASLLPAKPVVVDLGGNHGEFSSAMVDRCEARCTIVEPHPDLADEIRRRGIAERVIPAAIGSHCGQAVLNIGDNDQASTLNAETHDASNTENGIVVNTIDLGTVLNEATLARIHLLKVDIEGLEVEALCGLRHERLQTIDQITVEFHDTQGYVSVPEITATYRHLKAAGFRRMRVSVRDRSDVLFVNRKLARRGPWAFTVTCVGPWLAICRFSARRFTARSRS